MQGTATTDDPLKLKTIICRKQNGINLLRAQLGLLRHLRIGATSEKIFLDNLPSFNTVSVFHEEYKTASCYIGPVTKIGEYSTKPVAFFATPVKVKNYVVFIYTCKHFAGAITSASLLNHFPKVLPQPI